MFTEEQTQHLVSGRTGVLPLFKRWPKVNGLVTVPYLIDAASAYSK